MLLYLNLVSVLLGDTYECYITGLICLINAYTGTSKKVAYISKCKFKKPLLIETKFSFCFIQKLSKYNFLYPSTYVSICAPLVGLHTSR